MAAPVASYVQLPTDTPNTGKKNRTQTKVVGSDTVHEHFVVPSGGYSHTGRYYACSTASQTVSSVAQVPSTAGFYFLHNSTANTAIGMLRRVELSYGQDGTAVGGFTAPVLLLQKYTFATAHSGTTLSIVATQTSSTTPKLNMRSAPTGATITLVGPVGSVMIPSLETSVGQYGGQLKVYDAGEHYNRINSVEIGPGEGVVLHQLTSGNAADTRKFTATFIWDEIEA